MSSDSLFFKDDWPACRRMFTAWWHGEIADRWALGVLSPSESPCPAAAPPAPPRDERDWLDIQGNLARREASFAQQFYGGAWHPYLTADLGPCPLVVFLGGTPIFGADTVWYEPRSVDPAKVELRFDSQNPYWQWMVTALRQYRQAAKGRFSLAIPALVEGLDILAELFGTQKLLTWLLDCPQEVHRLLDELDEIYFQAYDQLYEMVHDETGHSLSHFSVWAPGRAAVIQCDFSCMISEDMFAEFVVPHLERQCARLDYSLYHLDGPDAVRHLEHLVKVPGLTAIEWTPGTGNPYAADRAWWETVWRPLYAAGKSAHCWAVPADSIEPFVKEFGQKGTLVTTGCESEAEARTLLEESIDWG
ncbi:MAG: hypothetical protein QGF67_11925 [Lentisphaeria bacterium]|jgi:hypothetical protein|nr:hypothetical protein [Lentisphaeria bacterium]MDP7742143.1 hypothetical protein [Lentisphaeria bacterium]